MVQKAQFVLVKKKQEVIQNGLKLLKIVLLIVQFILEAKYFVEDVSMNGITYPK